MPLQSKVAKAASKAATSQTPTAAMTAKTAKTATTKAGAGAKAIPTQIEKHSPRPAVELRKSSPSITKARRIVLGVGIFAIAVFGSIYGAGLKIRKDLTTEKEEWEKTSPEVQIMQLQVVRKKYERMANELKAKLEVVERRIKDKNTEDHNESAET